MRLRHAIPFTLIAGLTAAACAAGALAPEMAVRKAAGELGDDRLASYTVSIAGDEDAFVAFNDALIKVGSDEAASPEDLDATLAMLRSELSIVWDKGADAHKAGDDAFALSADVDGIERAVETRFVNGTIYARAQARRLAERFKAPAGAVDAFLAEAEAFGVDFLDEAVDGGWLAHDLEPIVSFVEGMAASGGFDQAMAEAGLPSDLADLGPEMFQGLFDALGAAYGKDVKVTPGKGDGPGDHYVLTATARQVYEQLLPAVRALPFLAAVPAGEFADPADIPDDTFALDLWIEGGNIKRAEFDMTQVIPEESFPAEVGEAPRMAVRVDIDRKPAAVTAPKGADKLDIFELFGKLAGAAGAIAS